jgi:hypothetical protein
MQRGKMPKGIQGFQKGHPVFSEKGRFLKGNIPWIKGRHFSDETRKKLSVVQIPAE